MKYTLSWTTIVALSTLAALAGLGTLEAEPTWAGAPASLTNSITLYPVADAWVNYYLPNNNYSGAVQLKVGSEECPGQEFPDRGRALLRFDLSAIPAGQVIQSATLQLYLRYAYGAATNTINVHRATASWTEGGTTWNSQPAHSTPFAGTNVGLTTGTWYNWDVTELVRYWYNGTYTNYGLKLISAAETTCNMRQFDSKENVYDPRLVITYSTPTPTLVPTATPTPTRTRTPGPMHQFIYLPLVLRRWSP